MNKQRKVIIWASGVIDLIEGKQIGGIAVQMYFWAQVFRDNGWKVYALSEKGEASKEGICFLSKSNIQRINLLLEWWHAFKYIITIQPELIIYRGANRSLLPLAFFSKLFRTKLLFFGASDVNFEPRKEITATGFNRKLFRWGVPLAYKVIVQNQHQHDTLKQNYGRDSLTMFNLWGTVISDKSEQRHYDAIWVANFRRLKRAEWVIEAAKKNPSLSFAIVGGPGEQKYYDEIKQLATDVPNVEILGPKSFYESSTLIRNSKVLLCTSTFEGFPNTFLQAWSYNHPVISTVDPSGVIAKNDLGIVIDSIDSLSKSLLNMICDDEYYTKLKENVKSYFLKNHSSQTQYEQLMKYVYEHN